MLVTDPGYSNHSQQPDIKKILANGTCQNENKKGKEHFRKHSWGKDGVEFADAGR